MYFFKIDENAKEVNGDCNTITEALSKVYIHCSLIFTRRLIKLERQSMKTDYWEGNSCIYKCINQSCNHSL